MKANDHYQHSNIEIRLAGYLAEAEARDPEAVRIIEDVMGLYLDGDAVDLYMEGMVDGALDRIAPFWKGPEDGAQIVHVYDPVEPTP